MRGRSVISLLLGRGGRLLLRYKLSAPCGAVAQLGERRVRNAKVGSSILLGSTKSPLSATDCGHFNQLLPLQLVQYAG